MREHKKRRIYTIIKLLAIAALIASLVYEFRLSRIVGNSMANTLNDGEMVLCRKTHGSYPKHEDIIVFYSDAVHSYLVKRVIAVGGDTIAIYDNHVILNNEYLQEDYLKNLMNTANLEYQTIPQGKLFVMGDNRNESMDSRDHQIGLVDVKNDLYGIVIFDFAKYGITENNFVIVAITSFTLFGIFCTRLCTLIYREDGETDEDEDD